MCIRDRVNRLNDFEHRLNFNERQKSNNLYYVARTNHDISHVDNMTLSRFYYSYVESYIYTIESSRKFLRLDGDPAEFTQLLSYDVGLFSSDEIFLLCKDVHGAQVDETCRSVRIRTQSILSYSFNLDPSICKQISIEIAELTTDYELVLKCQVTGSNKPVLHKNKVERKQDIVMKNSRSYNHYRGSTEIDEHSPLMSNSSSNYNAFSTDTILN